MKKVGAFVLAVCLVFLMGCTQNAGDVSTQGEFCRVVSVREDGIVVEIENVGVVYVKNISADLKIEALDTVVMEFSETDLKSESGKFVDAFGEEQSYAFILETPQSIRLADPAAGEPTFG